MIKMTTAPPKPPPKRRYKIEYPAAATIGVKISAIIIHLLFAATFFRGCIPCLRPKFSVKPFEDLLPKLEIPLRRVILEI